MTDKQHGGGWNKGKAQGQKRPFSLEHVQMIRLGLRAQGHTAQLALFEVALSTMLRAVDLLALTIGDVASGGGIVEQLEVMQSKTDDTVRVHLSGAAREALAAYLGREALVQPDCDRRLWTDDNGRSLKRLRYSKMVKAWAKLAHVDPRFYSTHSMRRTQAAHVYRLTQNHEAVRQLLGHGSLARTSRYLGVGRDDAGEVKRRHEM